MVEDMPPQIPVDVLQPLTEEGQLGWEEKWEGWKGGLAHLWVRRSFLGLEQNLSPCICSLLSVLEQCLEQHNTY